MAARCERQQRVVANTRHRAPRCESGCSCKPRYADGFTELPESTIYLVQLHATPSRNCTLVVINDSEPGGK